MRHAHVKLNRAFKVIPGHTIYILHTCCVCQQSKYYHQYVPHYRLRLTIKEAAQHICFGTDILGLMAKTPHSGSEINNHVNTLLPGFHSVVLSLTVRRARFSAQFLQRVSADSYAERCTSYSKSVHPSVRLSHAGTVSKRLKLRSCGLHWRIAP